MSSVSSNSSLSSTSSSLPSSPSSPASPPLQSLSPEQFWAKYRRSAGPEPRKFRSLFATLSLSEAVTPPLLHLPAAEDPPDPEPVYTEIYGAVRPPLPRKNSISKPPARPPLPAEKLVVQMATVGNSAVEKNSMQAARGTSVSADKQRVKSARSRTTVRSESFAEKAETRQ